MFLGFSGDSAGKESACRPGFDLWVGKIPWRRAWHCTPVFLPGESHGQRSLVGSSPWGHKGSDTTERLSTQPSSSEWVACFNLGFLPGLLQSYSQGVSRAALPAGGLTGEALPSAHSDSGRVYVLWLKEGRPWLCAARFLRARGPEIHAARLPGHGYHIMKPARESVTLGREPEAFTWWSQDFPA